MARGRPKSYETYGSLDTILEVFINHLGQIIRNLKKKGPKLFVDVGRVEAPKFDKLRPYLEFHLAMAAHQSNRRFGGPFQVKVLS